MNRRFLFLSLIALQAVLLTASRLPATPPGTYLLQQKYTPGTYYRVTNIDVRQKKTIGEETDSDLNIQQIWVTKMVIGNPDEKGNKTVTITYERIQDTLHTDGIKRMEYDSKDPKDKTDIIEQGFRPLLNAKAIVVLDKQNGIVSIQEAEGIWDQIQKENPDIKFWIEYIKRNCNNEYLIKMILEGEKFFPAKPIAVGKSWRGKHIASTSFGKRVFPQEITFTSVEKEEGQQLALIVFSGKGQATEQDKKQPGHSASRSASEEIQWKGMLRFDIAAGRAYEMNVLQTTVLTRPIEAKGTDAAAPRKVTTKTAIAMKEYFNEIPPELKDPPSVAPTSAPTKPTNPTRKE